MVIKLKPFTWQANKHLSAAISYNKITKPKSKKSLPIKYTRSAKPRKQIYTPHITNISKLNRLINGNNIFFLAKTGGYKIGHLLNLTVKFI